LEQARVRNEIQNNYFKTIVDETAVGLISFKSDGSVELFNEAAKKIFGIQVLRNLKKLNNIKEGFCEMLISMDSNDRKLVSLILDGELIQLATKKVKFRTGQDILHLVSFQNIKPELEEKEIESWQRLIRVLTHEIMNSMTPIVTLVGAIISLFHKKKDNEKEILIEPTEVSPKVLEKTVKSLNLVNTRGQGLIHFVQNYRSITKLPKPEFMVVNIRDLFSRVKLLFESQLEEIKCQLQIKANPSLLIMADGKLMEQVVINLVKNAMEALDSIENPIIELSAYSVQDQVVIQVTDNGKGIPEELIEDVFVPFFTTKQSGSGIGLSLSRQIVRLHGGSMTVQSATGKTVFTIRI